MITSFSLNSGKLSPNDVGIQQSYIGFKFGRRGKINEKASL